MDGTTWVGVGMAMLAVSGPITAGILRFVPQRLTRNTLANNTITGLGEACRIHGSQIELNKTAIAVLHESLARSEASIGASLARIEADVKALRAEK